MACNLASPTGEYSPMQPATHLRGAALAVALVLHAAPAAAQAVITSTFDGGSEGWAVTGDFFPLIHSPAGGNPGGFIGYEDMAFGDSTEFLAPASFRGNIAAYYGGTLSYDLRVLLASADFYEWTDVRIKGAVGTLTLENVITAGSAPWFTWHSYSWELLPSAGWKYQANSGGLKVPATQALMLSVLGTVTEFGIRGEFNNGDETDQIDNVVLAPATPSIPEPGTWAGLAGLGSLGAALCRRGARREP